MKFLLWRSEKCGKSFISLFLVSLLPEVVVSFGVPFMSKMICIQKDRECKKFLKK